MEIIYDVGVHIKTDKTIKSNLNQSYTSSYYVSRRKLHRLCRWCYNE